MLKILDRLENIFVVIAFFLATILVFVNVVLRTAGYGTTWSEELIRYLIIWLTFVGASICVRQSEHVGIDLLPEFLSDFFKKLLQLSVNIIAVIFLLYILKYSIDLIQFTVARGQIAPSLGIPMYAVYLCVPIGSFLMIVRYLVSSIHVCKNLFGS